MLALFPFILPEFDIASKQTSIQATTKIQALYHEGV